MKNVLCLWSIVLVCNLGSTQSHTQEALFNGHDFTGWEKYLGVPNGETQPLGINNDPYGVFSITQVDGTPAIRASGEVFGTLTHQKTFKNYHLKLEFKWGTLKWPPRLQMPRDAGLLYHGFGIGGSVAQRWHHTQECQIQEGDTGDYWPIGDVCMDIPAIKTDTSRWWAYQEGAPLKTMFFSKDMSERRILKYPNAEHPAPAWNTVEVYTWKDQSIHVVNGQVVMRLFNSRQVVNGKKVPLTSGRIALQSEGAEVFYRNVFLQGLRKKPKLMKKL